MRSSFFIFLVLATLTAIIVYGISHRYLLNPILNLSSVAKAVSEGDYKKRVNTHLGLKDELSTLCVLVNDMIDKVEDATESARERYRWLAENSHDVIWVMDLHGKFIYVSPSVERLRGFSAEEVMAQPFEEVICESSRQAVIQSMEEAVLEAQRGNTPKAKTLLVEQPCKDGSTVWTEVNARLVINLKDSSMQFIGVTRDITERLVAEEEIKKLGITFEQAGRDVIRITGAPEDFPENDMDRIIKDLLFAFHDENMPSPETLRHRMMAYAACRGAIKRGDPLNVRQMKELITDLFHTTRPFVCPHGRPTIVKFTPDELGRLFDRT